MIKQFYSHSIAYYWHLESLLFEFVTRFLKPVQVSSISHSLSGQLIVSLTSFPPRFHKLHLTIKCLLSQSIKPDRLILWIAHDDKEQLTPELLILEKRYPHFEIRYCPDYRSYKKLIPTLELFPDAFVVTADDDIYYPSWWLKRLCDSWNGDYEQVMAYRVHGVQFVADRIPASYSRWEHCLTETKPDQCLFATSGAGVLYPPGSLEPRVMDASTFQAICGSADDIWFFWMVRLNGSRIVKADQELNLVSWLGSEESGLMADNVMQNANDRQISNMIQEFGWPD